MFDKEEAEIDSKSFLSTTEQLKDLSVSSQNIIKH